MKAVEHKTKTTKTNKYQLLKRREKADEENKTSKTGCQLCGGTTCEKTII